MGSPEPVEEPSSYASYRVTVGRSVVALRYHVIDEHGDELFQVAGNESARIPNRLGPFRLYDAAGAPLAALRVEEAFYVPSMETYALARGDVPAGNLERRPRQVRFVTAEGEAVLVRRTRLSRGFSVTRGRARLGSLRRRRGVWERNYDLQLRREIDPIPLVFAVVLIDQARTSQGGNALGGV